MKNFRFLAIALIAFAFTATSASAQNKKGGWHDRMMSEKIAFLTMELSLTPEEAQVFWPVYNKIAEEKRTLQKAVSAAYKNLVQALREDTASDKELDKLLDDYLAAKQANKEAGKGDAAKFRKVLSSKKVAKLYVAEENFRRQHIHRMKSGQPGNGHGPQCPQGGKPGPRK